MQAMRVLFLALLVCVTAAFSAPARAQDPTPAPTSDDPYAGLAIEDLASRYFGYGELQVHQVMGQTPEFTRWLISYPSDEITVYGFMNVPQGPGPFPVVVAVHGYISPSNYETLDYTTRYADDLARAGYLVLHPNLRGYRPSDSGPNPFRIGMALDVLHLIGLVRQQGGLPGPLQPADPEAIGLWGHSMGGGIALRVLTIAPYIDAAVLYGSMSADERRNYEKIVEWSGGSSGRDELAVPEAVLERLAPIHYLDRIEAAVSIHHGTSDQTVPLDWSLDLCARLSALHKTVECFTYAGQPHTFYGDADRLFVQRTIEFFDQQLKVEDPAYAP